MKVAAKFEVCDRKTPLGGGKYLVVGRYMTRTAARRAADNKDNVYGAYRFFVQPVTPAVEIDTLAAEANPFMQD